MTVSVLCVSKKCFWHFFEGLHSCTGRSTSIANALLVTLGKCEHLLSLVGASASLVRWQSHPPGRLLV